MASSLNKVMLIGNLGKDPEMRQLSSGDPVANLRIATSESWRDKGSGEKREKTEWHTIVIFGPLAKIAGEYLRKGSKVYIEGQLQTRKWQDQGGADRYSTEVVVNGFGGRLLMLDGKNDRGERSEYDDEPRGGRQPATRQSLSQELDDEIPF